MTATTHALSPTLPAALMLDFRRPAMVEAVDIPVAENEATDPALHPAGLAAGTRVLTLAGELPVEHLTPGDRIITRDAGLAVLRQVESGMEDVALIRVAAGSLGHTRPERDMVVAPGTLVHVRDWRAQAMYGADAALIPAARLIDGEYVCTQETCRQRLYRLVLDRPHIIYADGLEIRAG